MKRPSGEDIAAALVWAAEQVDDKAAYCGLTGSSEAGLAYRRAARLIYALAKRPGSRVRKGGKK